MEALREAQATAAAAAATQSAAAKGKPAKPDPKVCPAVTHTLLSSQDMLSPYTMKCNSGNSSAQHAQHRCPPACLPAIAQGKAAAKPELPRRHNPIASLFPTHVISLEAPEPSLLSRCLALGEQEQAVARAAAAAAAAAEGKPVAAAGKGKPKEPAGPLTHNNDKDFK